MELYFGERLRDIGGGYRVVSVMRVILLFIVLKGYRFEDGVLIEVLGFRVWVIFL